MKVFVYSLNLPRQTLNVSPVNLHRVRKRIVCIGNELGGTFIDEVKEKQFFSMCLDTPDSSKQHIMSVILLAKQPKYRSAYFIACQT